MTHRRMNKNNSCFYHSFSSFQFGSRIQGITTNLIPWNYIHWCDRHRIDFTHFTHILKIKRVTTLYTTRRYNIWYATIYSYIYVNSESWSDWTVWMYNLWWFLCWQCRRKCSNITRFVLEPVLGGGNEISEDGFDPLYAFIGIDNEWLCRQYPKFTVVNRNSNIQKLSMHSNKGKQCWMEIDRTSIELTDIKMFEEFIFYIFSVQCWKVSEKWCLPICHQLICINAISYMARWIWRKRVGTHWWWRAFAKFVFIVCAKRVISYFFIFLRIFLNVKLNSVECGRSERGAF